MRYVKDYIAYMRSGRDSNQRLLAGYVHPASPGMEADPVWFRVLQSFGIGFTALVLAGFAGALAVGAVEALLGR